MPEMVGFFCFRRTLLLCLILSAASAHDEDKKDVTYSLTDLLLGIVVISALVGLIMACIPSFSSPPAQGHCCNDVVKVQIMPNDMTKGRGRKKKIDTGEGEDV